MHREFEISGKNIPEISKFSVEIYRKLCILRKMSQNSINFKIPEYWSFRNFWYEPRISKDIQFDTATCMNGLIKKSPHTIDIFFSQK